MIYIGLTDQIFMERCNTFDVKLPLPLPTIYECNLADQSKSGYGTKKSNEKQQKLQY